MNKHTPAPPAARKAWRITAAAPLGEYVTLDQAQSAAPPAADSGWLNSSVELERGATVTEYVWDRFPPEVLAVYNRRTTTLPTE